MKSLKSPQKFLSSFPPYFPLNASLLKEKNHCPPFKISFFKPFLVYTTRKLINTNGNTEGIFPSVNFQGILPTEIFPWYIPTELPWGKNLRQGKKKMTCHFYKRHYRRHYRRKYSLGNSVGKL